MTTLYVVSTPIGNLEDVTLRAIKTLFSVDVIACEDTRKTGVLLKHFNPILKLVGVKPRRPKLVSYYEENEFQRIPEIIRLLREGENVALVSNAGTPTISDPGFKLVKECIKKGIDVVPIPGASSILAALVISGLPTDKFFFLGYLPKKRGKKKKLFKQLLLCFRGLKQTPTLVFYDSPHRLLETLRSIRETLGDVEIVVTKELTKIHEEVWRGKISQALNYFTHPKGEFTILLSI